MSNKIDLTNTDNCGNLLSIKEFNRKKTLKGRIEELETITKVLRLSYSTLRPFAKYYPIFTLARHILEVRDETVKTLQKCREEYESLSKKEK